jgi:hypothetical protein
MGGIERRLSTLTLPLPVLIRITAGRARPQRVLQDTKGLEPGMFLISFIAPVGAIEDAVRESGGPADATVALLEQDGQNVVVTLMSGDYEYLALRQRPPEVYYNLTDWQGAHKVNPPAPAEPEEDWSDGREDRDDPPHA